MSTNPYASPTADSGPPGQPPGPGPFPPGLREDLKAVATYQRYVLWCLLLQIIVYGAGVAALRSGVIPLFVFQISLGLVGLAGVVSAILLGIRVYGVVLGILFGLFAFFPCIGLLILLLMNQRATSYLQQHGIVVGFMGADPDSIP